ncbi:hypothetical protein [Ramlibacter rhizophilus]|uniref:Uncharacterized protein n=1 Tax=Ramlibacter rhizophilus TaxID=1781167 RepID=A0A4Z0BZ86_9BURK|nr:hypothetical protein [Ramlibacter rhizophilus]TFZ04616.1 hypothetical protein EZ242_02380 [Ramlibacter rhizophilus]
MDALSRLARRPSESSGSSPASPTTSRGKDDKATPPKRLSLFGLRPTALGPRPDPTSPSALASPKSPPEAGSPSPRRVTDRAAVTLAASDVRVGDPFPDRAWLDRQAQAQGIKPTKDVVIGGKLVWRHGQTYKHVCSALQTYHDCPIDELVARQSALLGLRQAVDTYLGKKPAGKYEGIVRTLGTHLVAEEQRLAKRIEDARARGQQSPSIADVLQPAPGLVDAADPGDDAAATPPSDAKSALATRSASMSVSRSDISTSPLSEALGLPETNLYAATASATKLLHTLPTSGLLHASLLTTGATNGDILKPDVVVGGLVIKQNSKTMARLLGSLDRYHALPSHQLRARMLALQEVERNVEAYMNKRTARYRDAPAFMDFRTRLAEELRILTAVMAITVEAEWQRDTGQVPSPLDPVPQLNAQDAAELFRAGLPKEAIARGLAMHLSREQIMVQLAPCARARVPYTAVKLSAAASRSTVVPDSLRKLGSGAVATVWRMDLQSGDETLAMVFKPEPSPKTDIGEMARASGIPADKPNLSGRSAAAYLCSKHLGLDLVPPTVVAIADIDGSLEAGSLMEFVDGFQLVSEGAANRRLTADQARLIGGHPQVLQDYAHECGCTSARLDGAVLRLERRVQVRHDREGNPLPEGEIRYVPALIRMALPHADGRLRRLLADAQLFSRFIRDGDRSPMNFMFTVDEDGRLSPRFINNDVSFGPGWTVRCEPGTSIAERRVELPRVVSRSLKDAFDGSSEELGMGLEAVLGSTHLAQSVIEDISKVRALLATHDADGRILDSDADWESPSVTQALGLNLAGAEYLAALALRDDKGQPSRTRAEARIKTLTSLARTRGYQAREAMEERALELDWTAIRLNAQGKQEPPEKYFGLTALFDFDELMQRIRAASTDTKAGPAASAAAAKPATEGSPAS